MGDSDMGDNDWKVASENWSSDDSDFGPPPRNEVVQNLPADTATHNQRDLENSDAENSLDDLSDDRSEVRQSLRAAAHIQRGMGIPLNVNSDSESGSADSFDASVIDMDEDNLEKMA